MSLAIREVRSTTTEEWNRIWENCDYSTYFHSLEWAQIWSNYTNQSINPNAKIIVFSDGKSALLPFSTQLLLKGLVKQYILCPAGTFGGWLSLDDLSENHGQLLHKYIIGNCSNLIWRLNPYNPLENQNSIIVSVKDETHVLNLENGFDVIYKGWTKGHSSAARKARKAGVVIREACTLHDWEDYYAIYKESLKRWGDTASSKYSWLLFEEIYKLSSPSIKLWLAIYDDKIIAGALCFYAKKHVVYWHGAACADYFKLRPVNLLMYEVIKNSCEDGYSWFDFNPSGGHEGVKNFKKSFGAVPKMCPVVRRECFATNIVKRLRRKFKALLSLASC